jgi:putative glutamine amidotransferase
VPLVGICRGAQLLNLAYGGTLVRHLSGRQRDEHACLLYPADARVHGVSFTRGSLMERLYGEQLAVNSFHHQAVGVTGAGVLVSGVAPDGVVEAIELEDRRAVGVQWHPELLTSCDPVFSWLVEEAGRLTRPGVGYEPVTSRAGGEQ